MLIGRERELRTIRQRLDDAGRVVLVGPAGIGKSSLAAAIAAERPGALVTGALGSLRHVPMVPFRRLIGDATAERADRVAGAILRRRPPLLVLDDAQWADPPSLEVLAHLAGRIPLVVTVRDVDAEGRAACAALEAQRFEVIAIEPLADAEAARLVRARHPDRSPEDRRRLIARAGGNPLLLAFGDVEGAPATLATALLHRLEQLGPSARAAVERAALLGRPADETLLGAGTDEAVSSGLLVDHGEARVAIAHPLVGEVVIDLLGAAAAPQLRSLAAQVTGLEHAGLLARSGDRADARAAAFAVAEGAPDRATRAAALHLAIDRAPDGELDVHHRIEAAQLLVEVGRASEAYELCAIDDECTATLPPFERGLLALHAAASAWMVPLPDEKARWYERALHHLAGSDTAAEVQALAGSAALDATLAPDLDEVAERARRAVALAERIGQRRALATGRLGTVLVAAGHPDGPATLESAFALAEAEGDDEVRLTLASSMVITRWFSADAAGAHRLARRVGDAVAPGRARSVESSIVAYAAVLDALIAEDRSAALDRWRPHLEHGDADRDRCYLDAAVALLLADLGHFDDTDVLLGPARDRAGDDGQRTAVVAWAAAEAAWLRGDGGPALTTAVEAAVDAAGDHHPPAIAARLLAAHRAVELGEHPKGPVPEPPFPAWHPTATEWAGLQRLAEGDARGAAARLLEAAEAYGPLDVRSEVRCRWAAGHALVVDDPDGAERALRSGLDRAERHELVTMGARLRRSLRLAGRPAPGTATTGALGLTGREIELLDLVRAGFTSAQIGDRMHLGRRTVDATIAAAVRKLGVSTRMAAAAELERRRAATLR